MIKTLPLFAAVFAWITLGARADGTSTTAITSTTPTLWPEARTDHPLGAGVIFGEPTGASLKYWLNDTLAIDGAAGWSWRHHSDVDLQSDVLWHDFNLIPVPRGQLPVYFGAGGLIRVRNSDESNQVGLRLPVGVSYMFDNTPVDIFAEVAPVIDFAPSVRGEITGGIGIRYWF